MKRSRLVPSLLAELFETERFAYRCPIAEAERLGAAPPSIALRAVAAHANETLDLLPKLARARGVRTGSLAGVLAEGFATVTEALTRHLVDEEQSYRATLLGIRDGVDLVRLLRASADEEGDIGLSTFCDRWLDVRSRLVRGVEAELGWFARSPAPYGSPVMG